LSDSMIPFEQAIFTSVRTPMGEGYRIIAASAGLKSDEKQTITRNSPSHDSLCARSEASDTGSGASGYAVSYYALPTGRQCVGLSYPAGAEHTGRGGERVYTHVVVFAAEEGQRIGFNPFAVARAMIDAGMNEPQLKPPPKLPEVTLSFCSAHLEPSNASLASVPPVLRRQVLTALLDQQLLAVNVGDGWCETAEAIWLGLPGPLRQRLALSAGLKFSLGRAHNLQLLFDDKGVVKARATGQRVQYLDVLHEATESESAAAPCSPDGSSAWISFVERHWQRGEFPRLAQRTSQPFGDVSPTARERVGRLYNTIDDLRQQEADVLLRVAGEHLEREPNCPVEANITQELIDVAQSNLLSRFERVAWPEQQPLWKQAVQLWRRCPRGTALAWPVVERMLRGLCSVEPLSAAEAARDIANELPSSADRDTHTALISHVLARLADWAEKLAVACAHSCGGADESQRERDVERFRAVVARWRHQPVESTLTDRLVELCEKMTPSACTPDRNS
jgi:hypothetical protein